MFISLSLFSAVNYNLNLSRSAIIDSNNLDFSIQGVYNVYTPNRIDSFLSDNQTWSSIASEPEISQVIPYATGNQFTFFDNNEYYYVIHGIQESYLSSLVQASNATIYSGTIDASNFDLTNNTFPVVGIRINNEDYSNSSYFYLAGTDLIELKVIGWITLNVNDPILNVIQDVPSTKLKTINFISYLDKSNSNLLDNPSLKVFVKKQYIDLNDLDKTSTTYNNLMVRLNHKYSNYFFISSLSTAIAFANIEITIFQLFVLIFLLPFIFISLYISHLGSQLNLESRRIQYGLFLVRGGKADSIKTSYRIEGVIVGGLVGIISFILTPIFGWLLHLTLPKTTSTNSFNEALVNYFLNQNQIYQLFWSIVLGVLLGFFIMNIPNYYQYLNPKELLETHRYEEGEVRFKGRKDIILFSIGISPFVFGVLVLFSSSLHLPAFALIGLIAIGSLTIYILPFSPFLVSYGLSAYLARQPIILKKITGFYSNFIPSLREIIEKTIFSKINNLTRIAFVIALSFTFIITPLIASSSLQAYNTSTQEFKVGSDLALSNFNSQIINETYFSNDSFVQSTSTVQSAYFDGINTYYIDPVTYAQTANFRNYWNLSKDFLSQLTGNDILVNNKVMSLYNVKVGDSFSINSKDYSIIGTFGVLGGTDTYSRDTPAAILNNNQVNGTLSSRMLIKFTDPSNKMAIENFVSNIEKDDSSVIILSYYQIGETSQQFDFTTFLLSIIEVQAYLLAVLSLISLSFLMIIRIKERSREIGTWRSRGLDEGQLRKLISFELIILSSFGFLIGVFSGFILSIAIYLGLISTLFGSSSIVPYDFVIPFNIIIIFVIYVIGTIILGLFINYWTFRTKLSTQLRYEEYMR